MTLGDQVFTEAQRQLLSAVLNQIIPAEGELPGAGDLGLADFVEQAIAQNTRLRRLFIEGLVQIEITVAQLEGKDFGELPSPAQVSVLKEVESRSPGFFEVLVRQCYNGYYTSPEIFQLIGYQRTPPQDYKHQPFDETLLEPQRQRQPFWRQA